MPLHEYIKQIYKETIDPLYIIRFIDYLVTSTNRHVIFMVNTCSVIPLITGVLEDIKTKEHFYSLAQFYNKSINNTVDNNVDNNVSETDISIFKNIYVTKTYSLWRIICSINEITILKFFDQKYRSFLLYRNIKQRINYPTSNNILTLLWNNDTFLLSKTMLYCHKYPYKIYELFDMCEDGCIKDLYYCKNNTKYLITDT
jgi:hypothetical protein